MAAVPTTLDASPGESRVFRFDFGRFAEILAGGTISGASVAADDALTVETPDSDTSFVDVRITIPADTSAATYEVLCAVTTSAGDSLLQVGLLAVGGGGQLITSPAILLESGGFLLLE